MILFLVLVIVVSNVGPSDARCSMYGICERRNGYLYPCVANRTASLVNTIHLDPETVKWFGQLCPRYSLNQDMCCDHDQIELLVETLNGELRRWFYRCPACYANIASLYCSVTCDTNQSGFLSTSKLSTRDSFASYIYIEGSKWYVDQLFGSCEHVRYWQRDSLKAMDFFCEGCSADEFYKRLLRDYPLKPSRTFGMVTQRIGLRNELWSCPEVVSGFGSACSCADCNTCHVTTGPPEETTALSINNDKNNASPGLSVGTLSLVYLVCCTFSMTFFIV